jgi:hypothetical protein
MLAEIQKGISLRGEILDRVYVKAGCVQSLDGTKVRTIFCCSVWRALIGKEPFYSDSLQETFRKNALGLLSVAEVAGEEGVRAVAAFERTVGAENLKLSFFRGFETLFPPDMEELIARWRFILLMG